MSAASEHTDILDTAEAGPTAIRGAILRVGGYFATIALSVLSAALLIRYLGVDDFGRYATVIAIVTVLTGITEAGMTNVGVREYTVETGERRERMMRNLLGLRIVVTAAGAALGVAFAAVAGYDATMVAGTALGGVALVCSASSRRHTRCRSSRCCASAG